MDLKQDNSEELKGVKLKRCTRCGHTMKGHLGPAGVNCLMGRPFHGFSDPTTGSDVTETDSLDAK